MHIASVIHVTDLHLFVAENGETRSESDQSAAARLAKRLGFDGLGFASGPKVRRFERIFLRAVEAELRLVSIDGHVVVAQTGDVEAFGAFPTSSDFFGFSYLENVVFPKAGIPVVSVYGNHDVWPGDFPAFRWRRVDQRSQKKLIADETSIKGPLPPNSVVRLEGPPGPDIVIVPINTVRSRRTRGGVWSNGLVSPHPPSKSSPLDDLRSLGLDPSDINIVIQHHPVHFFGDRKSKLLPRWVGDLDDKEQVAYTYEEANVHLVMAGHRHALNPSYQTGLVSSSLTQHPLRPKTAQLVSLSPTISQTNAAAHHPSRGLCVYRIIADIPGNRISVERAIYPTRRADPDTVIVERGLIREIPLG